MSAAFRERIPPYASGGITVGNPKVDPEAICDYVWELAASIRRN